MKLKSPDHTGTLLLGIWLIVTGAAPILGIGSYALATILNLLAIGTGILLVANR